MTVVPELPIGPRSVTKILEPASTEKAFHVPLPTTPLTWMSYGLKVDPAAVVLIAA